MERGLAWDEHALASLKMRVIRRDCSSKEMTNRELDEMLKAFAAVAEPDDLDRQLALLDSPKRRREHLRERCHAALERRVNVGHEHSLARRDAQVRYLGGTAQRMFGRGLDALGEDELRKLMGAMEAQAARVCAAAAKADRARVATGKRVRAEDRPF